jgi:hypothetical protein
VHASLGFNGAFDGALHVRRLDACLEEPRGGTLEQTLEEPLDSGEGAGHQVAESSSASLGSRVLAQLAWAR